MALTRPVKIGTDCSGMEAPIQAMRNLPVQYQHKFSCDVNKDARATIEANFPHGIMYEDLTKRNNKTAPYVDIYIAGFPCQPFSTAGLQQGFGDKRGRGEIFFKVLDYIRKQKPRVFILENVSGLCKQNMRPYLEAILEELKNLRVYNVQWQLLDTKQHGVPQSRRRWYCIGIQKKFDNGKFAFPEPIARPSIEKFLERRDAKLAFEGLPPKSQTTARSNVTKALRDLKRKGLEPTKESYIVDCDSSPGRSVVNHGYSPCITCSRGGGHWLTSRGRRMLKTEMMRLQGMDPTRFTVAVSENRLGHQLGNTMSVCVLERLFTRLLPAAKLVRGAIKDRWASGQALQKLMDTRSKGFKGMSAKAKKVCAKGLHGAIATYAGSKNRKRPAATSARSVAKRQR
jgi:DNA (cytosine-5)-methyltransferase 1